MEEYASGFEGNSKWCLTVVCNVNITERHTECLFEQNTFTWLVHSSTFGIKDKTTYKKLAIFFSS